MKEQSDFNYIFTPDMIDVIARIWMRSTISLIDVRFRNICPQHPLEQYQMPSSVLIFAYGGSAQIRLNQTSYGMERFSVVHGGKGTMMSISPVRDMLYVFMVFYKAEAPLFFKKDLQQLLEQVNPFVQQFGYTPINPVLLLDTFQQMVDYWNRRRAISYLHAKSKLYQLIHEVYRDLESEKIRFLQPEPAISAKRYLDENYMHPIMFQEIADMFGISGGQLTRLFKKREGMSLQQYLTMKRLEAVEHHLKHTNATVKEIAHGCGFVDENLLLRIFKKHYKISPGEYRKKLMMPVQDLSVDNNSQQLYNETRQVYRAKNQRDGELTMFGQIRSREIILAAAMSLMLLLSACGAAPTDNSGPTSATSATSVAQPAGEGENRIVKAANGDVEVPINPQRLIVSGFAYGDIIPFELADKNLILEGWVDLGNKTKEWREHWEHATVNTTKFESFDDLEGIMTLNPDMIIATTGQISDNTERDLKKITSTILYDQENIDKVNYTMEDRMAFLGELFGMPEKAQHLVEAFNEKAASAAQALADVGVADKKIVFVHGLDNGTPVIATDINQSLTYKILGMPAPVKVDQEVLFHDNLPDDLFNNHVKILSMEVLPEYIKDADIIVYRHLEASEESIAAKLSDIEIWANVPAVKSGNVLYLPISDPLFGFSYADYMVALDTFIEMLKQLPVAKK